MGPRHQGKPQDIRRWLSPSIQWKQKESQPEPLPLVQLHAGEGPGPRIYVSLSTAKALETIIDEADDEAMVGLVLGTVSQNREGRFVNITEIIPLDLETPSAWTQAYDTCREEMQNTIVLGWYAVRPGVALGLTAEDRAFHLQFFGQSWQITYLIDPASDTSRFFVWRDRDPQPAPNVAIFDEIPAPPAQSTPPTRKPEAKTPNPVQKRQRIVFTLGILVLFTLLFPSFPWSLSSLQDRLARTQKDLAQLEALQAQVEEATSSPVPSQSQSQPDQTNVVAVPTPETRSVQDEAAPKVSPQTSRATAGSYIVKHGDTMWSISEMLLGNPHRYSDLAEWNDILNPNLIHPGERIQVPKVPEMPKD